MEEYEIEIEVNGKDKLGQYWYGDDALALSEIIDMKVENMTVMEEYTNKDETKPTWNGNYNFLIRSDYEFTDERIKDLKDFIERLKSNNGLTLKVNEVRYV